ncbi:hypothetical protein AB0F77_22630 [Streptomyces sp. NPDC026672]|uniref:hypothetical protein n=1 Tax=unclassified Streptomyces TaxID=2593676 RepID=UPI0033E5B239
MTERGIPSLFAGICDDAAIFPPGLAPLPEAVDTHVRNLDTWFAALTGPLVVPAAALADLQPLLAQVPHRAGGTADLGLAVTLPGGPAELPKVLASGLPIHSLEIALPAGIGVTELLDRLGDVDVPVFVEVPRDGRRDVLLSALTGTPYRAKFRTGGVRAELYPDAAELADGVHASVTTGVPFKATAGLHHAVRNTDPDTGFVQHGFLNLMVAASAAASGRSAADLVPLLEERDPETVADWVGGLDAGDARTWFVSFGTCSITDPLNELTQLGLITAPETEGVLA